MIHQPLHRETPQGLNILQDTQELHKIIHDQVSLKHFTIVKRKCEVCDWLKNHAT